MALLMLSFLFYLSFQDVLYFRRYCDQRRRKLLEHVHEGYEKEWWDYTDI